MNELAKLRTRIGQLLGGRRMWVKARSPPPRAAEATDSSNAYPERFIPAVLSGRFLFFPETGRFSKKNREAIEHERAITERDEGLR